MTNIESLGLLVGVTAAAIVGATSLKDPATNVVVGAEPTLARKAPLADHEIEESPRGSEGENSEPSLAAHEAPQLVSGPPRSHPFWRALAVVPGFVYGLTLQTFENVEDTAELIVMLPALTWLLYERFERDRSTIARGAKEGETLRAVSEVGERAFSDVSALVYEGVVATVETGRNGFGKLASAVERGEGFEAGETLGRGFSFVTTLAGGTSKAKRRFPTRPETRRFATRSLSFEMRAAGRWSEIFRDDLTIKDWVPRESRDALLYFVRRSGQDGLLDHVADSFWRMRLRKQRTDLADEIAYVWGTEVRKTARYGDDPLTAQQLREPAPTVNLDDDRIALAKGTGELRQYEQTVRAYIEQNARRAAAYAAYSDDLTSADARGAYVNAAQRARAAQRDVEHAAGVVKEEVENISVARSVADFVDAERGARMQGANAAATDPPARLRRVEQSVAHLTYSDHGWVIRTPAPEVQQATRALAWFVDAEGPLRVRALSSHFERGTEVRFYGSVSGDRSYAAWFRGSAFHVMDMDSTLPYPKGLEPSRAPTIMPDLLRSEEALKRFRRLLLEELRRIPPPQ